MTITVCPYFQPLDADIAGRYAEAGADAVAALLLPFSEDDVRTGPRRPPTGVRPGGGLLSPAAPDGAVSPA